MENLCGGSYPMSDTISVLWIDDENQTTEAKNLGFESLHIQWEHPKDIDSVLEKYENSGVEAPDLFLIDFYLSQKPINDETYQHQGLVLTALIREKYPEHPIFLVTAAITENGDTKLQKWSQAAESIFDKIIAFEKIQREGKEILYYDALDYRKTREKTARNNINALFELLKAPDSIKETLFLVLPDTLKSGLMPISGDNPEGNTIAFARWVLRSLLFNPGLLYDKTYTSTLLGVSEKGFGRISRKFSKAMYTGIFSNTTEPMWWASTINDIVFSYKKSQELKSSDLWVVSNAIFSITEEERSKCAVCDDFFPETVGTNIDNPNEVKPVHYKCSAPDKNKQRQLYFEGFRVFNRD